MHDRLPRVVLFDLDDTLYDDARAVRETFRSVCGLAAARYGVPGAVIERAVRQQAHDVYATMETFAFVQDIGINPIEALWGAFCDGAHPQFRVLERLAPTYRDTAWHRGLMHVGIDDRTCAHELAQAFYATRRNIHFVYEDTFSTLEALAGRVQLLLLTNGAPDIQKEKLAGQPRIASFFDHIVISGDYGRGKPHPELFAHALAVLGAKADEAIMIGDKLTTDIKGAIDSGIASIWIDRHRADPGAMRPTHTVRSLGDVVPLINGASWDA